MQQPTLDVDVSMDFSTGEIDYEQSVEVLETGPFAGAWKLRDPDAGISTTGESYLATRRKLTALRDAKQRLESAVEEQLHREARRLGRRHLTASAR